MPDLHHYIGRITRVNPARREIRVKVVKGYATTIENSEWLRLEFPDGEQMRCRVARCRVHDGQVIVEFVAGVTRENVGRMKACQLIRPKGAESEPPSHLEAEALIDFSVHTADGLKLGTVVGAIESKAHGVLEIENAQGATILLPLVEEVVQNVEWETRVITVGDISPFAAYQDSPPEQQA